MRLIRRYAVSILAIPVVFGLFLVGSYGVASGTDEGTRTSDDSGGSKRTAESIRRTFAADGVDGEVVQYRDGATDCVDVRILSPNGTPIGSVGGCNPAGVLDVAFGNDPADAIGVSGLLADPASKSEGWFIAAVLSGCECEVRANGGRADGKMISMKNGVGVYVDRIPLNSEPSASRDNDEEAAQFEADRAYLDAGLSSFELRDSHGRSTVVRP